MVPLSKGRKSHIFFSFIDENHIEYGIDDYIISAFHNGENYTDFRKTKIFSNTIGHYFARYGRKYYLDEFIRTNI